MGKQDTMTKQYMSDPHVFADVFNTCLYDGKKVIEPERLRAFKTTEFSTPHGLNQMPLPVQKERDLMKALAVKQDDARIYLLLGIENQMNVHYAMPVRTMLYDALQYAGQVAEIAAEHRRKRKAGEKHENPKGDEYLSGFYKSDRLLPVITLVVYFGTEAWDGPTHLRAMFDALDEETARYIPDYPLNLVTPADLTEDKLERFTTDFREVMLFIKHSKDKAHLKELLEKDEGFQNLQQRTVDVINAITNSTIKVKAEEGEKRMCIAWDGILDDMRKQARAEVENEVRTQVENEVRTQVENEVRTQVENEVRIQVENEFKTKLLIEKVCKKMERGKDIKAIADALEEDITFVTDIYTAAKKCTPAYDVQTIYQALYSGA